MASGTGRKSPPPTKAAAAAAAAPLTLNEPKATLYLSNIDWSVRPPLLRRSLHALLVPYGQILDVIAVRGDGLRGQAWVTFDSVACATSALRDLGGGGGAGATGRCVFFGRELRIDYAREGSDITAKKMGSYVPRAEREKREQLRRERREAEESAAAAKKRTLHQQQQELEEAAVVTEQSDGSHVDLAPDGEPQPTKKKARVVVVDDDEGDGGDGGARSQQEGDEDEHPPPPPPPPPPDAEAAAPALPSNVLFAQELPFECNELMLGMLFQQYQGFKEVRVPRPGLAFVEFDDEPTASVAMKNLNGFMLTTTDKLVLTYGKKT